MQEKIQMVIEGKKIEHEIIDIGESRAQPVLPAIQSSHRSLNVYELSSFRALLIKSIVCCTPDPASVEGAKDKFRGLMAEQGVEGADKALPPKIFNEDTYCGVSLSLPQSTPPIPRPLNCPH
jgi:hypothetical protein